MFKYLFILFFFFFFNFFFKNHLSFNLKFFVIYTLVSDWLHSLFNSKLSVLFQLTFFFKKLVLFSTKKKNEYYLYSNNVIFLKYFFFFTQCSLFDLVCFDNSKIFFLKYMSNFLSFFKFFIFKNNLWVNLITNKSEFLKLFKNSAWYIREAFEFFGISFFWKFDTRNLLTQYSSEYFILLKKNKLSSFYDIKNVNNSKVSNKKISIILYC